MLCRAVLPQELWKLYEANKLGDRVLISDKNRLPDFQDLVRSSKFCLAPWGHGWGNRLGLYMVLGCVPVIVQVGTGTGLAELWWCAVLPPSVCRSAKLLSSHRRTPALDTCNAC
jgi:hypothetical protein